MRVETSDLLAVLDSLDEAMTDIIFGLRAETLLPDQQIRLGRLFEATGLLLQAHAELTLRAIGKSRAADRDRRKQEG